MEHHITIREAGEGGAQAVCSCGWRSPVFGADKTAGTMTHYSALLMPAICTNGRCPYANRAACPAREHAERADLCGQRITRFRLTPTHSGYLESSL